jgi:pimeloyl-ACP methyl ester carboxylesterase
MLPINGVSLHYQQDGSGPDVVLVHAFTSNQSVWAVSGVVAELAARYRVTTYDLRGHGMSGVTPAGYSSAHMADDLRRLCQLLGLRSAHLVGHSFGGVIAVHASRLWPDLVDSIVLSDTYFPGLCQLEPNMGQTDVWLDLREQLLRVGADIGERVDFGRLFRQVAAWTPQQFDAVTRELGAASARWLSQLTKLADTRAAEEMFEVCGLTAEELCRVEQPVTALYDEFSPFEATSSFLEQNLPNCRLAMVPGAKHLAPLQNPAAFTELVTQHLQRLT